MKIKKLKKLNKLLTIFQKEFVLNTSDENTVKFAVNIVRDEIKGYYWRNNKLISGGNAFRYKQNEDIS